MGPWETRGAGGWPAAGRAPAPCLPGYLWSGTSREREKVRYLLYFPPEIELPQSPLVLTPSYPLAPREMGGHFCIAEASGGDRMSLRGPSMVQGVRALKHFQVPSSLTQHRLTEHLLCARARERVTAVHTLRGPGTGQSDGLEAGPEMPLLGSAVVLLTLGGPGALGEVLAAWWWWWGGRIRRPGAEVRYQSLVLYFKILATCKASW